MCVGPIQKKKSLETDRAQSMSYSQWPYSEWMALTRNNISTFLNILWIQFTVRSARLQWLLNVFGQSFAWHSRDIMQCHAVLLPCYSLDSYRNPIYLLKQPCDWQWCESEKQLLGAGNVLFDVQTLRCLQHCDMTCLSWEKASRASNSTIWVSHARNIAQFFKGNQWSSLCREIATVIH